MERSLAGPQLTMMASQNFHGMIPLFMTYLPKQVMYNNIVENAATDMQKVLFHSDVCML